MQSSTAQNAAQSAQLARRETIEHAIDTSYVLRARIV